jgi:hypothetical protein
MLSAVAVHLRGAVAVAGMSAQHEGGCAQGVSICLQSLTDIEHMLPNLLHTTPSTNTEHGHVCGVLVPLLQEPMMAGLGGAGPAYLRELSLLQHNTAAGQVGPVAGALLRHLPGMSEDGVAETAAATATADAHDAHDAHGSGHEGKDVTHTHLQSVTEGSGGLDEATVASSTQPHAARGDDVR